MAYLNPAPPHIPPDLRTNPEYSRLYSRLISLYACLDDLQKQIDETAAAIDRILIATRTPQRKDKPG